jgi:hypothetical protein
MIIAEIHLYELLKARIGEKEAGVFLELLDKKVDTKFEEQKDWLVHKQDLAELRTELSKTIYLVSLGQLLAIIASVVAIVNLLK